MAIFRDEHQIIKERFKECMKKSMRNAKSGSMKEEEK